MEDKIKDLLKRRLEIQKEQSKISAKKELLAEQKVKLLEEMSSLGVTPKTIEEEIQKTESQLAQLLSELEGKVIEAESQLDLYKKMKEGI